MVKNYFSIWPRDENFAGTLTQSESGPGSKELLHIAQSSNTGTSPWDGLVSYLGPTFGWGVLHPSAEYPTTPSWLDY